MAEALFCSEPEVVRHEITLAVRSSIKSRDAIADELSTLLGVTVTKRALDSYTAESAQQHRFPLEYTLAFCVVCNDYTLLHELVRRAGFRMVGSEDERLIAIGRAYLQRAAANRLLEQEAAKLG